MLAGIPLLIVPFILYNLGLAGSFGQVEGADIWETHVFSMTMMSGGVFSLTAGNLLIVVALLLLFVEIVKSTRTSNASIVDHLLSTFVFVAFLVEFLLATDAAHPVFFTLMVIALGRCAGRILGVVAFRRPGPQRKLALSHRQP
jgi:hypothetical protein